MQTEVNSVAGRNYAEPYTQTAEQPSMGAVFDRLESQIQVCSELATRLMELLDSSAPMKGGRMHEQEKPRDLADVLMARLTALTLAVEDCTIHLNGALAVVQKLR